MLPPMRKVTSGGNPADIAPLFRSLVVYFLGTPAFASGSCIGRKARLCGRARRLRSWSSLTAGQARPLRFRLVQERSRKITGVTALDVVVKSGHHLDW